MKKLLVLLGSIGLTSTAAIGVVACGVNNHSEIIKTDLKDLNLKTLLSLPVTNQQAAFDLFIELNPEVSDLRAAVQVIDFIAPDYNQTGSLEVQAEANAKYSGTLMITIPEKIKTNLEMLISNRTIEGTKNMTATEAFNAFLVANNSWTNLSDFVSYGAYTPATYQTDGLLTIIAKENTEFIGEITVNITKLKQTDLSTLELSTTVVMAQDGNQDDAFNAFLEANKAILGEDLTYDQVELSDFQAPGLATNGMLTITVKTEIESKYTGTITVEIGYFLDENNISDVIRYLSDNNLIKLYIPTGTKLGPGNGNLLLVLMGAFKTLMDGVYEYGSNISAISLKTYDQGPNQDQLDTKGYVWQSPSNTHVWVDIAFKDGTTNTIRFEKMNVFIIMV